MLQINASIAQHCQRTWCAYRTRNLYFYDAYSYLIELDANFQQISEKRLTAENGNTAFEDVRLFSSGPSLLAFYTYLPINQDGGWDWIYGMGYGIVDTQNGVIRNQVSFRSFSKRLNEKNWVPYMYKDELFLLTDFDPYLRVLNIGNENQRPLIEEIFRSPKLTKRWGYGEIRGGTPLLADPNDDDHWLYGFVHSYLTNYKNFRRYYFYTAVKYNHLTKEVFYYPDPLPYAEDDIDEDYADWWDISNGKLLKVIFPIGIIYHHDGVLVSFGKDDVCSYTEHFSWEYIRGLFNKHK